MDYKQYVLTSLQIFFSCFIIGVFVDSFFYNLQQKYNYKVVFAFSQLITIITITFFMNKFFYSTFEEYSPHILFSTFILSLQSNMINNFKDLFNSVILLPL
jgi:hypothetical protein